MAGKATVRLDLDNAPDALLRIDEDCGGQSRTSEDDYVEDPLELIMEVAHSSAGSRPSRMATTECSPERAAYDLHDKKGGYRRGGVQEYVVWQVEDERVDWFVLEEGAYRSLSADEDGRLTSRVFPGLVLDVEALLRADLSAVPSARLSPVRPSLALPLYCAGRI